MLTNAPREANTCGLSHQIRQEYPARCASATGVPLVIQVCPPRPTPTNLAPRGTPRKCPTRPYFACCLHSSSAHACKYAARSVVRTFVFVFSIVRLWTPGALHEEPTQLLLAVRCVVFSRYCLFAFAGRQVRQFFRPAETSEQAVNTRARATRAASTVRPNMGFNSVFWGSVHSISRKHTARPPRPPTTALWRAWPLRELQGRRDRDGAFPLSRSVKSRHRILTYTMKSRIKSIA
jgi:hypothetical protein